MARKTPPNELCLIESDFPSLRWLIMNNTLSFRKCTVNEMRHMVIRWLMFVLYLKIEIHLIIFESWLITTVIFKTIFQREIIGFCYPIKLSFVILDCKCVVWITWCVQEESGNIAEHYRVDFNRMRLFLHTRSLLRLDAVPVWTRPRWEMCLSTVPWFMG